MIDNYQLNLITPGNFRTFHDNLFQINIILMMIPTNSTLVNHNTLQYGYLYDAESIFKIKNENKNLIIPLNNETKTVNQNESFKNNDDLISL